MTSGRFKRISNELASIESTKKVDENGNVEYHLTDYIKIKIVDDTLRVMKAEIKGLLDFKHEDRTFELLINLPEGYPFNPPDVKFITKISHPNVVKHTGRILGLSRDWSPAMSVGEILMNIYCLLGPPSLAKEYIDYNGSWESFRNYMGPEVCSYGEFITDELD